jgi:hypothetical protein
MKPAAFDIIVKSSALWASSSRGSFDNIIAEEVEKWAKAMKLPGAKPE